VGLKDPNQRVPGWPEYVAELKTKGIWDKVDLREAATEEWRRLSKEEHARDEAPVVAALRVAGLDVNSAWDMVNRKESFPLAMPVLRQHLELDYPPKVREGIARAMSDGAARPYWRDLVHLYQREADKYVKDALAIALNGAAGPEQYEEVIALALDPVNGPSRIALIWTIQRRVKPERAEQILLKLATDPVTKQEAERALKSVKSKLARQTR
jgi:hypothetical protein